MMKAEGIRDESTSGLQNKVFIQNDDKTRHFEFVKVEDKLKKKTKFAFVSICPSYQGGSGSGFVPGIALYGAQSHSIIEAEPR